MANQNIVITTKVEGLQAIERLNKEIDELKSVSDKASKEVTRLKSKIDRDLARAAAKSAKQIDKLQAKMERGLARAAARTTLQIDKLKSKIDRDLARAAAKSAKQIDRLEDKIKSLRVATRRTGDATSTTSDKFDKMGGQFSKVGGLGGELGGVFDALSVTMSGPLGLAIGAVTVGLGAAFAVTRQVNQSFENMVARADEAGRALTDLEESVVGANARMEASEKRLTESFDNFVVEFTGGAKKLDAEAAVFDVLAGHLEKFAGLLVNTQPVVAYAQAVQSLGQTALVAAANYDQFNLTFGMGADAAEAFSQNLDTLVDVHNEGAAAFESGGLISLIDGIGNAASMAADKFFDLADSVRSAVNEMSSVSDKALKGIKKPKRRRRRGGGGRKRKTKAERRQESGLAMVEDLAIADEPFDAVDAAAARGIGVGDTSQININELEDLAAAAAAANAELQEINIEQVRLATILDAATAPALQMVAEGMIQVGEATVFAMGSFAAGVGSLNEFGDSVLDMFSNLSSQIGSFFIRTGIGMAFISPGTGAGLISAGLALQFLGGALGAKGSGNAGTGGRSSGGGGSGTSGAVTREIQRSLRGPDAGGSVTNIEVVIAGRAIEPEMVSIIDDMARLRRSRTFGRMGV